MKPLNAIRSLARHLLTICLGAFLTAARASTIAWGVPELKSGSGQYSMVWNGTPVNDQPAGQYAINIVLYFSVLSSSSASMRISPIRMQPLTQPSNWIRISEGGEIGPNNTQGNRAYFLKGLDDEDGKDLQSDYNLTIPKGETVYLGFCTENGLYSHPFYDPEGALPKYLYGWVELTAENGSVSTPRAAIEVSGSPIPAGQVPEPASYVLSLLGIILLVRRRRYKERSASTVR